MYAIQVWFDGDWMYVTERHEHPDGPFVKTFHKRMIAEDHAYLWRKPNKEEYVRVVSYEP